MHRTLKKENTVHRWTQMNAKINNKLNKVFICVHLRSSVEKYFFVFLRWNNWNGKWWTVTPRYINKKYCPQMNAKVNNKLSKVFICVHLRSSVEKYFFVFLRWNNWNGKWWTVTPRYINKKYCPQMNAKVNNKLSKVFICVHLRSSVEKYFFVFFG